MVQDLTIKAEPDGTAVVYTGFVNGFERTHTITFHFFTETAAKRFVGAFGDVTGVEIKAAP